MNFNNSRLVDHKPMKFGTFVPYMYRFVINALVNSIQRRIRTATAARGGTPDIDFQFDFDFKISGVATNELQ